MIFVKYVARLQITKMGSLTPSAVIDGWWKSVEATHGAVGRKVRVEKNEKSKRPFSGLFGGIFVARPKEFQVIFICIRPVPFLSEIPIAPF